MNCHECARDGQEEAAVGLCRFCHVGLCKSHLVASYRSAILPQYACEHHPKDAFAVAPARSDPRLTAVGRR